ncbi:MULTISPECIES: esterase family protein [Corynebacterium]|uniref:alpha/beta hydrolase n=1 Tax=Corynebacterium TaxID=1716 RepID=UPI00124DEE10|nr:MULTISPECIES: alpha/beta hydrolase-fold protein [Corynebacterium]
MTTVWRTLTAVPLTTHKAAAVSIALLVCALVAAAILLLRGGRLHRRVGLIALATGALVPLGIWIGLEKIWRPFPDHIPTEIYLSGGVAVAILVAALASLAIRPRRRGVLLLPFAALALVGALMVANTAYQVYPTLGALDPRPHAARMSMSEAEAMRAEHTAPKNKDGETIGALVSIDIPSGSGYQPRPAQAYLPPAFFSGEQLPVLMLMPGSPGSPPQWFTTGQLTHIADAFQQRHNGAAPLILSVDATGALAGAPKCVGEVEDYLRTTVPNYALSSLGATPDRSRWSIGGLSYGGTCALQIFSRHPDAFGTVLDYSGEAEPSVGNHEQTVQQLFDGSEEAFAAHNPRDILRAAMDANSTAYRGRAARFAAGERDHDAQEAMQGFDSQLRSLGVDSHYQEYPGGHTWQVWRAAITNDFEFIAQRGGLT